MEVAEGLAAEKCVIDQEKVLICKVAKKLQKTKEFVTPSELAIKLNAHQPGEFGECCKIFCFANNFVNSILT